MQKFRLLIGLLDVEASSLLDKWIGLAVKNEVQELDLNVQTDKNAMYTLPWIIFSAASFNALKLEGCKLEQIPETILSQKSNFEKSFHKGRDSPEAHQSMSIARRFFFRLLLGFKTYFYRSSS